MSGIESAVEVLVGNARLLAVDGSSKPPSETKVKKSPAPIDEGAGMQIAVSSASMA